MPTGLFSTKVGLPYVEVRLGIISFFCKKCHVSSHESLELLELETKISHRWKMLILSHFTLQKRLTAY
jgi:hypothetical protein